MSGTEEQIEERAGQGYYASDYKQRMMLDAFFQRFILTVAYLLANFDGLLLRWIKEML